MIFSQGEFPKNRFDMLINQLATQFNSLKGLYLVIPVMYLDFWEAFDLPWKRNLTAELSEEDVVQSFVKIIRNLVGLESLDIFIKRLIFDWNCKGHKLFLDSRFFQKKGLREFVKKLLKTSRN